MQPEDNHDQNTDPNQRLRQSTHVQPLSALEPHLDRSSVVDAPAPSERGNRELHRPTRYYPWKQWALIAGVVVVLGSAAIAIPLLLSGNKKSPVATTPPPAPALNTIRLMATGDFMADGSINAAALKEDTTYDYFPLLEDVAPLLKKADIRYCNDPILNGGKQFDVTGAPDFNTPVEFVRDMQKVGCNVVSTASNHTFDRTQEVISASVYAWEDVPDMLAVVGQNRTQEERNAVHYFTINGIKFAFLAYTTYTNKPVQNSFGVNVFSEEFAGNQIDEAKAHGAQFIIVSMRWGAETAAAVTDAQRAQAVFLSNNGVDVVLGHGPQALQPVQEILGTGSKKTLVWYSLGSFLHERVPAEAVVNGVAVMDIDTRTRKIATSTYLPTYMHYKWTGQQAATNDTQARTDVHLMLLENATQALFDAQQLKTTPDAQKQRLTQTLSTNGLQIPLITSKDL